MHSQIRHDSAAAFVIVALLSACGHYPPTQAPSRIPPGGGSGGTSTSGAASVHQGGVKSATASIGPAGGSLSLTDGSRLEIPPGALDEPTELTLSEGTPTQAFNNLDYEKPIGPSLLTQPAVDANSGQSFKISIRLPALPDGFSPEDVVLAQEIPEQAQRGFETSNVQTRWQHRPASVDGTRAQASVEQLFGFRLQFVVSSSDD